MGIFPYEVGRAEQRSSIRASLAGRAEARFSYMMGRAEDGKTGYQTHKIGVGWESLGRHGLPNTPLAPGAVRWMERKEINAEGEIRNGTQRLMFLK